jgi:hypothetical protein
VIKTRKAVMKKTTRMLQNFTWMTMAMQLSLLGMM